MHAKPQQTKAHLEYVVDSCEKKVVLGVFFCTLLAANVLGECLNVATQALRRAPQVAEKLVVVEAPDTVATGRLKRVDALHLTHELQVPAASQESQQWPA